MLFNMFGRSAPPRVPCSRTMSTHQARVVNWVRAPQHTTPKLAGLLITNLTWLLSAQCGEVGASAVGAGLRPPQVQVRAGGQRGAPSMGALGDAAHAAGVHGVPVATALCREAQGRRGTIGGQA